MIIDKNNYKHELGKNQIDEKENNPRFFIEMSYILPKEALN